MAFFGKKDKGYAKKFKKMVQNDSTKDELQFIITKWSTVDGCTADSNFNFALIILSMIDAIDLNDNLQKNELLTNGIKLYRATVFCTNEFSPVDKSVFSWYKTKAKSLLEQLEYILENV